MKQSKIINEFHQFLPFLTQTQSWMDRTYRSSEDPPSHSDSKPTTTQPEQSSLENFVRCSENLDSAQMKPVSQKNLVRRSMGLASLPDGGGTDEDDPGAAGYFSFPTGEHDPSMLAEEFDEEQSDIGQKLSMYHVSRKKVRDSAKQRYEPPLLTKQNLAFHAKKVV